MTATPPRLGTGTKLSYAVGNVGLQMLVAAMSFLLMIFYTDVALVPPAIAGAALLVGKFWDAVNDPLLGWMSDRTRSRHGRHRVYLLYGALPLALAAAAVWMVPPGLSPLAAFVWIALTYTLFDTLMTLVQLPYSALATELTLDYDERTSLTAFASMGALLGFVGGSVLMPLLVRASPDARTGYALAGLCFGVFAGLCVAWVAWRVREPAHCLRPPATHPPMSMAASVQRTLQVTLHNRPFVLLVGAVGLVRLGLTLVQGALAYFVVYRLQGDKSDLPRFMGILLLVVGVSLFGWKRVVDGWEKSRTYVLGMGAHWIVPFSMVPDTIDHGHMQAGERTTGMYLGFYGLVDKLARTLATVLIAGMLDWTGYAPNVPQGDQALQGIALMTGPLHALCLLLAIPLLLAYPITRAQHATIRQSVDTGIAPPALQSGGMGSTGPEGCTTRSATQNGCAQDARAA